MFFENSAEKNFYNVAKIVLCLGKPLYFKVFVETEVMKMMTAKKENSKETREAKKNTVSPEDFPNELREAIWSVVSFDRCEAKNLTYAEAEQKLAELDAAKVSGLCIVTDETAARIAQKP